MMNMNQQMMNAEFLNQKSLINSHHSNKSKNNILPNNTRISAVRHEELNEHKNNKRR